MSECEHNLWILVSLKAMKMEVGFAWYACSVCAGTDYCLIIFQISTQKRKLGS